MMGAIREDSTKPHSAEHHFGRLSLSASISTLISYVILIVVTYHICSAIYNVTFHPLAQVPGPKIAGATKLYQTFWSLYQGKSIFYRKIEDLHQKYGRLRPKRRA